jgi:phosphate transport system protein
MNLTHTDRAYENELTDLREKLLAMGAKVEEALAQAMRALVERDSDLAHRTIARDNDIDQLEKDIDDHCLRILAKRQPVASDLRFITIALKFVTDLERIGDLAVNISERAIELNAEPALKPYIDLPKMSAAVQATIRGALDALVAANADLALTLIERDHQVDAYFGQVFRELLTYMMEDARNIQRALKILTVAKHLERAGDHATNLAELVVFMARGKDIRHPGQPRAAGGKPHGVLFLCRKNSARSQIAEAWARKLFPAGVRIWSAGSAPAERVDQRAALVMREVGLDLSNAWPKAVTDVPAGDVDLVITLCAEEGCPTCLGALARESWAMPDPAGGTGSDAELLQRYRTTRDEIRIRIEALVSSWNESN